MVTLECVGAKHIGAEGCQEGFKVARGSLNTVLATIEFNPRVTLECIEYKPWSAGARDIEFAHALGGGWFSCYVWVEIRDN